MIAIALMSPEKYPQNCKNATLKTSNRQCIGTLNHGAHSIAMSTRFATNQIEKQRSVEFGCRFLQQNISVFSMILWNISSGGQKNHKSNVNRHDVLTERFCIGPKRFHTTVGASLPLADCLLFFKYIYNSDVYKILPMRRN